MRRLCAAAASSAVALATIGLGMSHANAAAAPDDPTNMRGNNYETIYHKNGDCYPSKKTVTGTIKGMDKKVVDVFIGMDIRDSKGTALDGGGCGGSKKDNTTSYGVTLHMNYWVGPAGADPANEPEATMTFSALVPGNASLIDFESSAQKTIPRDHPQGAKAGGGDDTYYGNSRLGNIKIGTGTTKVPDLVMPNNSPCGTQTTGAVTGYFYKKNSAGKYVVVNGVRVSAFAEDPKYSGTPASKGPFGYGRWTNASGYRGYTVAHLAASTNTNKDGQAYTLIADLKDGTHKQFYMVDAKGIRHGGVKPCTTTRFDMYF